VLFVALFVCLNNLVFRVRVPVSVFFLNMSKKGKKQDVLPYRHWKILLEQSPPFIRNKSSKILFKKAVKKYYLAQY